jgi:hypothetical protein
MKKKRKNKGDRELEELKQLYEINIEAIRELRKLIEEDRKRAEEDRKKIENLTKSISDLNGIWSDYTEKIILDGFENAAKEYGLEIIQEPAKPPKRKIGDKDYEIDGLAVGRDFVIVIETKTKFRKEDFKAIRK